MLEVTALYCYPIKSCGQVTLNSSLLSPMGLAYDRQWMLVDEAGIFLSQRTTAKMGLIAVTLDDKNGHITVNAPGMPPLQIAPEQTDSQCSVAVWKDQLKAEVAESHINEWFSQFMGSPCRLVRYGNKSQRLIDPNYSNGTDEVAFADGFPLLITHESTLEQLNQQLAAENHPKVSMQRFRPNIVVKSSAGTSQLPAQDEFTWSSLFNEEVNIELVKPCSRCVMTNLDPKTAEITGNTVLKTLALKHRLNKKATFGINGISDRSLRISVGDQLKVRYQKTTENHL